MLDIHGLLFSLLSLFFQDRCLKWGSPQGQSRYFVDYVESGSEVIMFEETIRFWHAILSCCSKGRSESHCLNNCPCGFSFVS